MAEISSLISRDARKRFGQRPYSGRSSVAYSPSEIDSYFPSVGFTRSLYISFRISNSILFRNKYGTASRETGFRVVSDDSWNAFVDKAEVGDVFGSRSLARQGIKPDQLWTKVSAWIRGRN
jgi:hypothetical protein